MHDFDFAFSDAESLNSSDDSLYYDDVYSDDNKSHHHKHHHHHSHKHHHDQHNGHKHEHHHSATSVDTADELKLQKADLEKQTVQLIKDSIKNSDVVKLGRVFDLGIRINGHEFLLYASKVQNVDFEIVKLLIEEGVSLDSAIIGKSDIMRSLVFNGRSDLLRLIHSEYKLNFEDDNSSEILVQDLSSVKLSVGQKIEVITTLYELGYKFPLSEDDIKFSKMLSFFDFDKKVVKHAKYIESEAHSKISWLKKVFKH